MLLSLFINTSQVAPVNLSQAYSFGLEDQKLADEAQAL
jgi:hypothetical protein